MPATINFLDARLPDRFWSKVQPCPVSGCWLWTGATCSSGYGVIGLGASRTERAHRLAYLTLVGPVPTGLDLDHLCRIRCCCNPAHLEPVTRRTNLLRGDTVTARSANATHCPKGHPYDDRNTTVVSVRGGRSKGRQCRECNRQHCADWYARKSKTPSAST